MSCPPEIADIVCDILQYGLVQIRAKAWENDSESVAQIAEHLHNLPHLLRDFSPELLTFYWEVERTVFLESVTEELSAPYGDAWNRLERHVVGCKQHSGVSAAEN